MTTLTIDRAAALRAWRETSWDDGGLEGAVLCGWEDHTATETMCPEEARYSLLRPESVMHPRDREDMTPWIALCGQHTAAARTFWPDVIEVRDVRAPEVVLPRSAEETRP
jgi:hypothetical protein